MQKIKHEIIHKLNYYVPFTPIISASTVKFSYLITTILPFVTLVPVLTFDTFFKGTVLTVRSDGKQNNPYFGTLRAACNDMIELKSTCHNGMEVENESLQYLLSRQDPNYPITANDYMISRFFGQLLDGLFITTLGSKLPNHSKGNLIAGRH